MDCGLRLAASYASLMPTQNPIDLWSKDAAQRHECQIKKPLETVSWCKPTRFPSGQDTDSNGLRFLSLCTATVWIIYTKKNVSTNVNTFHGIGAISDFYTPRCLSSGRNPERGLMLVAHIKQCLIFTTKKENHNGANPLHHQHGCGLGGPHSSWPQGLDTPLF